MWDRIKFRLYVVLMFLIHPIYIPIIWLQVGYINEGWIDYKEMFKAFKLGRKLSGGE